MPTIRLDEESDANFSSCKCHLSASFTSGSAPSFLCSVICDSRPFWKLFDAKRGMSPEPIQFFQPILVEMLVGRWCRLCNSDSLSAVWPFNPAGSNIAPVLPGIFWLRGAEALTITAICDNPCPFRFRYSRANPRSGLICAPKGQLSENRYWRTYPADTIRVPGPGA